MNSIDILVPGIALAIWTKLVLLGLGISRWTSVSKRTIHIKYFELYQNGNEPPVMQKFSRNYSNLLESPVLFYFASVCLYITNNATPDVLGLAWAYLGLRIFHTIIHVTINHVQIRFGIFVISSMVLLVYLILTLLKIIA